ncbi:MAG: FAD-binding oxidoreductase [Candidatus Cloacimonetes bacterium]|nr:FAD-binding oxidoreductase [Candidatus Cloacimonadota bacterium]
MPNKNNDVIIIGAGSIGVPAALSLAEKKLKVLVIDSEHSVGQQNNKKAIGGVRATHSDFGKINICKRSIEIFSTWKEKYGNDIGWLSHGYSFPAYTEDIEKKLKDLIKIQTSFGLNIKWISSEEYETLVPGIEMKNLRGSTYSPEDGSCSPLLSINAMYLRSLSLGAEYHFSEKVKHIITQNNKIVKIKTNKDEYSCGYLLNAAGNNATELAKLIDIDLSIFPDNHEAGITEPVKRFFEPMIVDLRKRKGSTNFYFYQNNEGQVVFCITPEPSILGIKNDSTSAFLPMCSRRMLEVYPRLGNLRVRRTWRGQYPMTPDGFPIIGKTKKYDNYINAVGMCGQGFMLGPGVGELISRIVLEEKNPDDNRILESFDLYRDFSGMEQFK